MDEPLVFAVDASVWPRCDAETSPERGFYYHPSRHSAGQPIVPGWAYQFVAQPGFARESWIAPVDVECVRPGREANAFASEQVGALLARLEGGGRTAPLFVFDAGYYDPVKLQRALERSACQILSVYGRGVASTATPASAMTKMRPARGRCLRRGAPVMEGVIQDRVRLPTIR